MSLKQRVLAELQSHPPGVPVPAGSLAERLQCSLDEVLAVGVDLQRRELGDEELVTVVKSVGGDGNSEIYFSRLPMTLNDEPETETR